MNCNDLDIVTQLAATTVEVNTLPRQELFQSIERLQNKVKALEDRIQKMESYQDEKSTMVQNRREGISA